MPMNWLRGLRGGEADANPEADRIAAPAEPERAAPGPEDPPEAWMEAVCQTGDKSLAAQWLARVEGEALLAEVAVRSRFAEVRLAAARRIADPAVLKRVAEASQDKHVHRYCAGSLKAHRQENERVRRAVDFEAALHALLDAAPIAISHLLQIEKDLAALGPGGEETAECEALLAEARARVLEETQAQIELRARLTESETLRAVIASAGQAEGAPAIDEARIAAWREQAEDIARLAATGPAWLASLPAARSLASVLEGIDAVLAVASEAIAREAAEAAQRAAEAEATETARKAREAEPVAPAPARRAAKSATPIDREAVLQALEGMEQHLEEGRTAEAEAAMKSIDHALGGTTPSGQIARRLQRGRAQLARLAGWARWGTDRAREQLIGVAEALLRGEPDIDERARAVPLLRREWKNLDAHGNASQPAWKRFDRALEKAYKPVAELHAAEAAAHAAACAAREALCESWEAWLAAQAADAPDLKALEAKREEAIAAWRKAPRAGYRDERKLRKRFDALVEKLDAPLESARAQELARREALVAAAQALAEETDLGRALSAAKSLQRRWKEEASAVHLKHGADQKLWQKFRKACDAAFARRDLEQAAEVAQRTEREQARQAELEAARAVEVQKKEKHAARFARMAEAAVAPGDADAGALERGHAERDALLLDLEIALDLQTPESHATQRRARMLARLQDRFRSGTPAQAEPEALVKKWYAIVATPDPAQAARIAAVVQKLLDQPAQPARVQGAPARHESRQGRRASRS